MPCYRDADKNAATGTLGAEEVLFFTHDKQSNVTTVWNENQEAVERYLYTAYGERTVLDGTTLAPRTVNASTVDQLRGHQGLQLDRETGGYYNRGRNLLSPIGVFNGRDPKGTRYQDGMNLHQYVQGNPLVLLDPMGEQSILFPTGDGIYHPPNPGPDYPGPNQSNLGFGTGPMIYTWTSQSFLVNTCELPCGLGGKAAIGRVLDSFFDDLRSFWPFNRSGLANVSVSTTWSKSGTSGLATFNLNNGNSRLANSLFNDTDINVLLKANFSDREIVGTTLGAHMVAGKRRWGVKAFPTSNPCETNVMVFTEAYERDRRSALGMNRGLRIATIAGRAQKEAWDEYTYGAGYVLRYIFERQGMTVKDAGYQPTKIVELPASTPIPF